jgi:hypothetical protein
MKTMFASALAAGLLVSFGCLAAAPAGAPAGSTALCKDGTYFSGAEKKGACSGHKGVKEWWGAASAEKPAAKTEAKSEAKPAAAPAPAATKAEAPKTAAGPAPAAPAAAKTAPPKPAAVAAPGGGAGKVWVNTSTKVYHCQGTQWYGKTKQGEYMTEADATAKGFKPDHGKACK